MKWLFCVLLSWAGSWLLHPASAQQVSYTTYMDYNSRTGEAGVIGKATDRYLTFRNTGTEVFIDVWNEALQPAATVLLDFMPERIHNFFFSLSGDSLTVLYQYTEGRNLYLYGALLGADGRLLKRPVKLDEQRTGILGVGDDAYYFLASDDKKQLAAYSLKEGGRTLESRLVRVQADLTGLQKAQPTYRTEAPLLTATPLLQNNGQFVVPVRIGVGSRETASDAALLVLADSARSFRKTALNLEGRFIQQPFLKTDAQTGGLVAVAFYAGSKNGPPEGVWTQRLEGDALQPARPRGVPFTEKLRGMTGNRSLRHAFANQQLRQLILKNDGGMVVVSEEAYVNVINNYTPGWGYYSIYNPFIRTAEVREYFYNDILVLSILPDGNSEWPLFVRKQQYSQGDGGLFSGYFLTNTGSDLHVLYNNYNRNRSAIELVEISREGTARQSSFQSEEMDMPDWLPRSARQVSAREVLVPCLTRKKLCFARVRF